MRKLILCTTVSADGYVCGANREMDWMMRSRDAGVKNRIGESLSGGDVHVMGRKRG